MIASWWGNHKRIIKSLCLINQNGGKKIYIHTFYCTRFVLMNVTSVTKRGMILIFFFRKRKIFLVIQ